MRSQILWRRFLGATTIALLILVAGCGNDDPNDDPDANDAGDLESTVAPLTREQLETAVVAPENLSDGWSESTDESTVELEGIGCPALITGVAAKSFATSTVVHYGYQTQSVPSLLSMTGTFTDADGATAFVESAQTTAASCSSVTGTDDNGTTWTGSVTAEEGLAGAAVDQQVLLSYHGRLTTGGGTNLSIAIEYLLARLGPNVALVQSLTFDEAYQFEASAYLEIAIDRFVAAASGEVPPATTGPRPS